MKISNLRTIGLAVLTLVGPMALAMVPPRVSDTTPRDKAVDVPTDVEIVIALETAREDPGIQLFVAGTKSEVPLGPTQVTTWSTASKSPATPSTMPAQPGSERMGATCRVKPRKPLSPRTRYEIRCRNEIPGCAVSFTTGRGAAAR